MTDPKIDEAERAVAEAWAEYTRQCCMSPEARTLSQREAWAMVERAIEARYRAKLLASVPPMTMTAEREATDREMDTGVQRAFAELDATRLALAAEREARRAAAVLCEHCAARPAVCFGTAEGSPTVSAACDECCGHGNEDGWCVHADRVGEKLTKLGASLAAALSRAEAAEGALKLMADTNAKRQATDEAALAAAEAKLAEVTRERDDALNNTLVAPFAALEARHARLREAAQDVVDDRDETHRDEGGDYRLCGWCGAILPDQSCPRSCKGHLLRAALAETAGDPVRADGVALLAVAVFKLRHTALEMQARLRNCGVSYNLDDALAVAAEALQTPAAGEPGKDGGE